MPSYDETVAKLRTDPEFAAMRMEDQYAVQKDALLLEMSQNETFRAGPIDLQKQFINEKLAETYIPVLEKQSSRNWLNNVIAGYSAGNPEARAVLQQYYTITDVSDHLPLITGAIASNRDPGMVYERRGLSEEYSNSPINLTKTRGDDDNKMREVIRRTFTQAQDAESIAIIDDKRRQNGLMAARIGEEVVIAIGAALTGGAVSAARGAALGAKGLQKLGKVGFWIAKNTPGLATEATIEGVRGMADHVNYKLNAGDDPTVGGALQAFGAHAAVDFAIGHVVDSAVSGVIAARKGYDPALAEDIVNTYGQKVARGEVNFGDITMPAGLDEDHFRALSSVNMTRESLEKLNSGIRLQDLTELEQSNLRVYRQGFDLSASPDGKVMVQKKGSPSQARVHNNVLEAEEWVGSQGSKILDEAYEAGDYDYVEAFIRDNPQLNYHEGRAASDRHWRIDDTADNFRPTNTRRYLNPAEMKKVLDTDAGEYVRFDIPVKEADLKKNKDIIGPLDQLRVIENPDGNAMAWVGAKLGSDADYQTAAAVAAQRAKDPAMKGVSQEALIRDELVKKGYTGIKHTDGTTSIFFADKVKIANRNINPETGNLGKLADLGKAGKTKVTVTPGKAIGEIANSPKKFAEFGMRVFSGDVKAGDVRRYAEGFINSRGVKKTVKVSGNNSGTVKVFEKPDGDIAISTPRKITDPTEQRKVYNEVMRGLDRIAPGKGKITSYTKQFSSVQKDYTRAFYSTNSVDEYVKSLKNLDSAQMLPKHDGKFRFQSKRTGRIYLSDDANALLRDLAINDMDEATFAAVIKNDGYEVITGQDVPFKLLDSEGKIIAEGKDQINLARAIDFYPDKLPSSMAPKSNLIQEIPGLNLRAIEQISTGNAPELAAFMGNFVDYHKLLAADKVVVKKNGDSIIKLGKARYDVEVKELNYTKSFDNLKDAKQFLEKGWREIENVQQTAMDKGFRMFYEDGQWKLLNGDVTLTAKGTDELMAQLSKSPNPTYGKEVIPKDVRQALEELNIDIELPPGFSKMSLSSSEMAPKLKDWESLKDSTPGAFDKYFPRVAALRRLGSKLDKKAGKIGLNATFERLHKNARISMSKSFQDSQELFSIFKEGKQTISSARRKGMTYYIEASTDEVKAQIVKDYGLTDFDINKAIPTLKSFYSRKGDELGIPFEKILTDYQPHVRAYANRFKEATDSNLLTRELISVDPKLRQFVNKKGFEFYSEFERFGDARKAWMDDDALSVALKYSSTGNRKYYVNNSWQEMFDLIKSNKGSLEGEGYISLIRSYKDALTRPQNALHKSSVTKSMNNMLHKLGFKETAGTELIDTLISMPYLTNMAFRPWLPFRNMFQVFTILPLRTGNIHTSVKAAANFSKDYKGILKEMLDEGIIARAGGSSGNEYLDLMRGGSALAQGKGKQYYDSAMELGLSVYGMSDNWTRGVAYLASKDMFTKGMRKSTALGKFDANKFLIHSRSEGLPESIQAEILSYIQAGNLRAAETTMARANIDATMFDYSALNKPLGASGTFGHLFYQFGTYSLNYMQSVGTAMAHGSTSSKVKSMIAMSAGMGIVAAGMKQAGVENSSFLGYKMAIFNGGPYFHLMNDALNSTAYGIKGDLARQNLGRQLSPIKVNKDGVSLQYMGIAPGALAWKYMKKSKESWDEGDYWGAWLAATTTPEHKSRNE